MDQAELIAQLLERHAASDAPDADLLLGSLSATTARLLELCAIPHTFDANIVRLLAADASESVIADFMSEAATLHVVSPIHNCLRLHETMRRPLFARWLRPERQPVFAAASQRLAAHYARDADYDSRIIAVFHQIGSDRSTGLEQLQIFLRELRLARLGELAETLLRVVGEYRPALNASEVVLVDYLKAQLESDRGRDDRVREMLEPIDVTRLPTDLAIRVLVLRGASLRRLGHTAPAAGLLAKASALAGTPNASRSLLPRLHHELGEVARARRNVDLAEYHFQNEAQLAGEFGDRLGKAAALNGLASAIQRVEPDRALSIFESIKPLLDKPADALRRAALLNNIGRAAADMRDWSRSLAAFEESLTLKQEAADVAGIAATRLNMARVLSALDQPAQARAALTESAMLFESLNRQADVARARRELARLLRKMELGAEAKAEVEAVARLYAAANDTKSLRSLRFEFRRKPSRMVLLLGAVAAASLAMGIAIF